MTNIIQLQNAARIHGFEREIVAEVVTITPQHATTWLRANKNNRPVRRTHVAFLSGEITDGNWQVNGQAIVISDNEQVLDGQHRLLAVIESGMAIQSLVVYGISPEAFRTIDTGAVRTGADALYLHFPDLTHATVKCVSTAVQWCVRYEEDVFATGRKRKVSNTEIIRYVQAHPSLVQCAETLQGYPHEARPLSLGTGTALFELFARKMEPLAQDFMMRLYTGEGISRDDPEWHLRHAFLRDAQRSAKLPSAVKMKMVVKGWNWRRRGMPTASHQVITVQTNDSPHIKIL
jgi:hypothetical protein